MANPTSRFSFECDESGRFSRAFLPYPFATKHQAHVQGVLDIDGSFMKHQVYQETMPVSVDRDGNNSNIILGVALCEVEDKRNCS